MAGAIGIRGDYSGTVLRRLARRCRDADQVRRLLSLAVILDGGSRSDAAKAGGVAAKELDGSCKAGHPCPVPDPFKSRDALVLLIGKPVGIAREGHVLVRGPMMTCRSDGGAGGGRTAAFCVSPQSGDVSCNMVAGGWAAKWQRYWRNHKCR